jgi:hypothetical protein
LKSDYRQFTDQLAADASGSASTTPHPSDFAWLVGDWIWQGQPMRFAKTAYGLSCNGDPYLIHNVASSMWILVLADPDAFGILIGLGLRKGDARFTGDVTIDGQPVRLRQTWRRDREFAVEIRNERHHDGQWMLWDQSLLERVTPLN